MHFLLQRFLSLLFTALFHPVLFEPFSLVICPDEAMLSIHWSSKA